MRRRILCNNKNENWILPDGSKAKVLDVVFANKNSEELIIAGDWSLSKYPTSEWQPIGVVVIPGEHGVLKDGTGTVNQCGIISIVPMSYYYPEEGGTSEQNMCWGGYGTDITGKSDDLGRYDSYDSNGLINYNQVVVVNKSNPTVPIGTNSTAYMSRQTFVSGTPEWYNSTSGAPSPYAGNDYKSGGLNPAYISTDSPSSSANCLSDFRGIVNTKIITDIATSQNGWKTASGITNSGATGYYPAACCCARFKTINTKSFIECSNNELKNGTGFWYMPSCGELGYILPKLYDINQTISALNSAYGVGVQLDLDNSYWPSTEYSNNHARNVYTGHGLLNAYFKDYRCYVRAFMRL